MEGRSKQIKIACIHGPINIHYSKLQSGHLPCKLSWPVSFSSTLSILLHNYMLYLELLVCEVLSQLLGYSLQILEGDLARLVIIKQAESFQDLLFGVLLSLKSDKVGDTFYHKLPICRGACGRSPISTIFCVMTARKSAKEIFPVPSLSTSPVIFLISSFFGSNPRARIATWHSVTKVEDEAHKYPSPPTPPPPQAHVDCHQCVDHFLP